MLRRKICDYTSIALTVLLLILLLTTTHTPEMLETPSFKTLILAWYTEKGRDGFLPWIERKKSVNCLANNITVQCKIGPASLHKNADGFLFYATFLTDLPLPRDRKLWGLVHEESPRNVPGIMTEEMLNLFNFSSTLSRFSDVPMSLLWMRSIKNITSKDYFVDTLQKKAFLDDIAPVLYMQSHCDTLTERDSYVEELMKLIRVDSYGGCLNNRKFPKKLQHYETSDSKDYLIHLFDDVIIKFIAKYKFVIAIENAVCNDYVTEKLWRAIHVGTVPIYYGSPVIRDWLPNKKSAILIEDFPTPELMSKHLHELLNNDTMYEEYLEHKIKGLISNRRIYEEMEARPYQTNLMTALEKLYCVICERLHENSSRVNVVTKKHYDCPVPTSALTLSVNPNNPWLDRIKMARQSIIYQSFVTGVSK